MPRNRPGQYPLAYAQLLETVLGGRPIVLAFDTLKEAHRFRAEFNNFTRLTRLDPNQQKYKPEQLEAVMIKVDAHTFKTTVMLRDDDSIAKKIWKAIQ